MSVANHMLRKAESLFEKKVRQALTQVKNGSITVIKQDDLIIQINISENLDWNCTSNAKQLVCNRPRLISL